MKQNSRLISYTYINAERNIVVINGEKVFESQNLNTKEFLTEIYKTLCESYPKFYKMDIHCKLGYLLSELLLQSNGKEKQAIEDRAIVVVNSSSSLCSDILHEASIEEKDNYFPSPANFVYTLANIVTGEIAIKNKYYGETISYIHPSYDSKYLKEIVDLSLIDECNNSILLSWIESVDTSPEGIMFLISKEEDSVGVGVSDEILENIWQKVKIINK